MPLSAVLFGSIGTLTETSELQRKAYNAAFAEHGLNISWDPATYRRQLAIVGGRKRLAALLESSHRDQDIDALHTTKTRIFQELIRSADSLLRPGALTLLEDLRAHNVRIALASTTFRSSIDELLHATGLAPDRFAVIASRNDVRNVKPAREVFDYCRRRLGLGVHDCVAIEDTSANVAAAQASGLSTVAVPGAYAAGQSFESADLQVAELSELSVKRLSAMLPAPEAATA
ncbi:MAG: HAD-IA family hydrolase [Pseudomonadota bacterium]